MVTKTLDAIISRFAMQYLDARQQAVFLKEISRVLKEGGVAIIVTVGESSNNQEFNNIIQSITSIISNSSDWKRRCPSLNDFIDKARFEDEYSLSPIFGSKTIYFPISISAWSDRFKLNEEQVKNISELYESKSKEFPDLFEVVDGELCLKSRIIEIRFKKNKKKAVGMK